MSTPETAARRELEHPLPHPPMADARPRTPDAWRTNPPPVGISLPIPTAPVASGPRKTSRIQRVGYVLAAISCAVGVYFAFFA